MEEEKRFAHGIGIAAGEVWSYLNEKGEASPRNIAKGTGLRPDLVQRAIGWLAREDKLDIDKTQRGEQIRLR